MNYYPYFSYFPTPTPTTSTGIFSRLFRNGINWGSIVNNTQKTLNIINQAIPVVKQVSPVVKNAKTMFKVMNEFKKVEPKKRLNLQPVQESVDNSNKNEQKKEFKPNTPTFFA